MDFGKCLILIVDYLPQKILMKNKIKPTKRRG